MLEKICNASEKLFVKYGIKSITMDDVAKDLSISKKTLYQFVEDKDDLVKKTITLHLNNVNCNCENVMANEENAILQIFLIAEMMISMHQNINPSLIYDLKKYHPESYEIFKQHRENAMHEQVVDNLSKGIHQKLYKSDLDIEITAGLYMGLIEVCLGNDIEILAKTPFPKKYQTLILYHLSAITSEEGKKFIEKNNQEFINKFKEYANQ
jgi:TetR/AcrR family transcriptional regulator, cholesterol catabolism regulator